MFINMDLENITTIDKFAVCWDVRGRALTSHTGVRWFDFRGGDCLLLFADYKLRSIYKS